MGLLIFKKMFNVTKLIQNSPLLLVLATCASSDKSASAMTGPRPRVSVVDLSRCIDAGTDLFGESSVNSSYGKLDLTVSLAAVKARG